MYFFLKKGTCVSQVSIIILICQKLGLVGPIQQIIKLPSPKMMLIDKQI